MKKSLLTQLRTLLLTAITAGALWACQDEKPEIHFPDPVIPQKEFKHIETLTPDTLTFHEGDSAVFRLRTIPYNLLSRDSLTIQVSDTAGAKYEFAEIKSYKLDADSVWNLVLNFKYGMEIGDRISIMVADNDTVIYSDETVLNMILKPVPKYYSLRILNDSVSGYLRTGVATIRLKTDPWNMLFEDSITSIAVVDTAGNAIDENFSLDSIRFQPADSVWNVYLKNVNRKLTSALLVVNLTHPDTVMVSDPIYFERVSFSMSSVKTGSNVNMKFASATNTYSYCMPTTTDFTQSKILFVHTGDKVTLGDSVLAEGKYNILDLSKPVKVSLWKYDLHEDYTIRLYNTGLPVVRITASGRGMADFDRSNWVEGITMRIEYPDGTVDYEGTLSMKGRGNGTWHEPKVKTLSGQSVSKRPYALRLDEKEKILGMHKQKRWILIANYKDRTLLRNDAAYWLSRNTEMPYTVEGQFVELVWNGVHVGNYYLCEQARIDNHRIDIVSPNLSSPRDGGYFMEIDTYYNYGLEDSKWADKGTDIGFWSNWDKGFNLPYIFKDPDEQEIDANSASYRFMHTYIMDMEKAIKMAGKKDPGGSISHEYEYFLDVDRAIDFLLIQEITLNHDAYNTWPKEGPHSAFLYKDSAGLMCFGPMWDFDYHTFMPTCEQNKPGSNGGWGWNAEKVDLAKSWVILDLSAKTTTGEYYFQYLINDPKFKKRLVERWDMYKDTWRTGFPAYVDEMANKIRTSESYNWSIWGSTNVNDINPNGDQNQDLSLSFQNAVNRMKQGFSDRWTWLDGKMNEFRSQVGMN